MAIWGKSFLFCFVLFPCKWHRSACPSKAVQWLGTASSAGSATALGKGLALSPSVPALLGEQLD